MPDAATTPPVRVGLSTASAQHQGEAEHVIHDRAVRGYVLVDQLELLAGDDPAVGWDAKGWIGGDLERLYFRTEGEGRSGRLDRTESHFLYGRPISNGELMDRLAGITTERLTDLAGRLFFNTTPTLSAIGPVDELASMDEISQLLNNGATPGHKTAAE